MWFEPISSQEITSCGLFQNEKQEEDTFFFLMKGEGNLVRTRSSGLLLMSDSTNFELLICHGKNILLEFIVPQNSCMFKR